MTTYALPTPEGRFKKFGSAYITPSDDAVPAKNLVDAENGLRVRFIQARATGVIVFRHIDETLSVPIDVTANQAYELGTDVVHIMATGTTATNLVALY